MVTIRLENVSKSFAAAASPSTTAGRGWLARALGSRDRAKAVDAAGERGVQALSGLDLVVPSGQTTSVVGPSGCGKTTLLRVIAGLETPDGGRVFFDDVDVSRLSPSERGIGMVFQSYALYPHMDGKGNLAFYFRMHHRTDEVEERVRLTSQMLGVGFAELLDKKPPKLSAGQQQRLAIGRCIVRDPTIFLFDEPLSNVDAKVRVQTRVVIKRLLYRFGITSVYVTHDQTEAITLGDRLAVMREGRIEQEGTYAEIFERPANLFVAGFVGVPPMSFFAGLLVERGLATADGTTLPLPPHLVALAPLGASVTLGVRAKDLVLCEPTGGEGLLGIVEVVETPPSERHQVVHVRLAGVQCQSLAPRELRLKPGYVVRVEFVPQGLYLFDGTTGRTLWPR